MTIALDPGARAQTPPSEARADAPPEAAPKTAPKTAPKPAPAGAPAPNGRIEALLRFESQLWRAPSERALLYQLVNGPRRLAGYGAAFALRRGTGGRFLMAAASGVAALDRDAPMIQTLERLANARLKGREGGERVGVTAEFELSAGPEAEIGLAELSMRHAVWMPLARNGRVFGALLFLREAPFVEAERAVLDRIAEAGAHAWWALGGGRRARRSDALVVGAKLSLLAAVAALLFVQVPLTVLAPAEVVGRDPLRVAAPIAGVVEQVSVAPNAPVRAGDLLFRLNDVDLRNELSLAEEEVAVAQARLRRAEQAAFVDPRVKRDIAVAAAEMELAAARRDHARERLAQTEVRAPADGLALFSDPQDWVGRPVAVGEAVMALADPTQVEYRIDLPLDDAVALAPGSDLRVFLDADPLHPRGARLERAAYEAEEVAAGRLAYRLTASRARDGDGETPRIGLRGVAQIYGEPVSLGFWLFRRPIAWLRQTIGV